MTNKMTEQGESVMDYPSINPIKIFDIKLDKQYILGAKRKKSRDATLQEIFGVEDTGRYSYYKTKGFFSAQLLLVEHYLKSHDTIAVIYDGEFLLKHRDSLLKNQYDIVLFKEEDWKPYSDYIFKDKDTVRKNHRDDWDSTVFNRNPSAIFYGDMSLPRYIARELKSERDWKMYLNARENFNDLIAA